MSWLIEREAEGEAEGPLKETSDPPTDKGEGSPSSGAKKLSLENCNEILPHLYLGGVQAVRDPKSMIQERITAVCVCLREMELSTSELYEEFTYFRVDVEDMGRE